MVDDDLGNEIPTEGSPPYEVPEEKCQRCQNPMPDTTGLRDRLGYTFICKPCRGVLAMADGGDEDEPLMLSCWNCGAEFEQGSFGYLISRGEAGEACPSCGFHFTAPPSKPMHFDEVASYPDQHPSYTLDHDEVRRRLPAISLIGDAEIAEEVTRLSADAPAYFWRARAARMTADYHHPIGRERHGLWAHTLMLIAPVHRLWESYWKQGRIPIDDRDHALAAAILHDQRKRGPHGSTEGSSVYDHDLQMATVIEEESDLPQSVADAVASHMGPNDWGYAGPEPETALQDLIHVADMMASTSNADLRVPGPVPEELEDLGLEEGDF